MGRPRIYYLNENYFDNWSPNMAYILGFITADGHIGLDSLTIALNPKDIEILQFIRSEIGSDQKIDIYKSYHKKLKTYYDKCRISFHSKAMCDLLRDKYNLIPNKTGKEKLCFDIPDEFGRHYLRGLFDGDGYVGLNGRGILQSYICSSSKIFIEQLVTKFGFGYSYAQPKENGKYIYEMRMCKQESIRFRDFIYAQKDSYYLNRKKYIFYEYSTMIMNYYSDEEDEILYKYAPDWKLIEKLIDRDRGSIYYRAKKLNLRCKERFDIHFYSDHELEYIKTNFDPLNSKSSIRQISENLNIPLQSIENKVQNLGLKRPTKYSQQELDFIKESIGKLSLREMSKKLKRSRKTISDKVKQIKLEIEI